MCYKKLIFVLILPLFIISCSDSNDDDNVTFLEKYNNTVWVSNDFDATIYGKITDNLNSPFEMWALWENCFNYEANLLAGYTILENSENKFQCRFKATEGGVEYTDLVTISVSNQTLTMEDKFSGDGIVLETFYLHFEKTTVNVGELPLCDDSQFKTNHAKSAFSSIYNY